MSATKGAAALLPPLVRVRSIGGRSAAAPRGVAIVMVLAVLAALMAIAAPFVFSMIQHGQSASNETHQQMAHMYAESAKDHLLAELIAKQRDIFAPLQNGGTLNDLPPFITTRKDLVIDWTLNIPDSMIEKYKLDYNIQNSRGMLWWGIVEDDQGKINVNTAPPALIGNLLASALLTEGIKQGDTQLTVDDASMFSPNGGVVCLNGEPSVLHYTSASSGMILLSDAVQYDHQTGSLVYDGRGTLICDAILSRGTGLTPFASIYEIKTSPGLTGNCALPPEDFARIERQLTVESGMNTPMWGHGEMLGAYSAGVANTGMPIENAQGFCAGLLIRFVRLGEVQSYGRIRMADYRPDGSARIEYIEAAAGPATSSTDDSSSSNYNNNPNSNSKNNNNANSNSKNGNNTNTNSNMNSDTTVGQTFVEPQMKNPVNINTASDEVLAAVFTGVCLRGNKFAVPRATAQTLVKYIRERQLRGYSGGSGGLVFATNDDLRKLFWQAQQDGIVTLPQRDALVINAIEPNSARLSLSTVTFCGFSHGTYTLEASGVSNTDNGDQRARVTLRQQVTLPTFPPGRSRLQYQADFQNLLDLGMANRVYTYPEILGTRKNNQQNFNTLLNRYPRVDSGNVRLTVGASGLYQGHASVTSEWYEPCSDESSPYFFMEGYSNPQPWSLDPAQPQGNNGGIAAMGYKGVAQPPTSIELWYRPKSSSQCTFYDEGTQDDRNRVNFSYDPGEGGLVIRIWDSTLNNGRKKPVEFIYPYTFNAGDWYHIAASWKTSHPGGQEIRVDAQPFPNNDPTQLQFKPGGRLGSDLSEDDNSQITLENGDGDDFPRAGALKIGEEIIEYTTHGGNSFSGLYRGARMSAAIKHKSGEWVVPFGYVNPIADDLIVGGATMSDDLAMSSQTHTRVQFPPNAKPNFVLDSATDKIPVEDATNFPPMGFVVIEGECIFYGSKAKSGLAWELRKLQRAMSSGGVTSPARNLHNNSGVALASIAISKSSDYLIPGIVQVDDEKNQNKVEWIYYNDKQDVNGKHFLVAELQNTGATQYRVGSGDTVKTGNSLGISRFRHVYGIGDWFYLNLAKGNSSSHTKGTKVIPVIRMNAPHCGGFDPANAANQDDTTTVTNNTTASTQTGGATVRDTPYGADGVSDVSIVELGQQDGDLRWVKQAYMHQYVNTNNQPCPGLAFTSWSFDYLVGLNDFVSRRYPRGTTRYLHWPTGELPDALGAKRNVCADKNGEGRINGDVDELHVCTFNTIGGRVAMDLDGTALDASTQTVNVENFDAWPQNGGNSAGNFAGNNNNGANPLNWPATGGLVRCEDELMYYTNIGSTNIQYYSDTYPPLNTKPPERNKADRRWVNPCTKVHELHPNIVSKSVSQLTNVKRGVLNTKAVEHPVGAQIMLLDAMPVTHLTGALSGASDSFTVAEGKGFPTEGYAWINDEIVGWKQGQGTSFNGCQYLHGRYGTSPAEHDQNEIVRCLPFRYWDRDASQYDGDGLAFIQTGYRAQGAKWYTLEMDLQPTETMGMTPSQCVPHVLVRFNGKPAWDAMPEQGNDSGLYEFVGKRQLRFTGMDGYGVTADQMELRVYWQYLPGAFKNGAGADWKRTFTIEKMRASYKSPLILRRLDEVERR
ncbi:MAG TPA: hypothetical protein VKX17_14080 [Planctomycetota bacterium]|nr:hypothetical protein [Planctomycetota bacterium]